MINRTEEYLLANGYWFWSKGDKHNPPMIAGTAKWNNLIKELFAASPYDVWTEDLIWKFLNKNNGS